MTIIEENLSKYYNDLFQQEKRERYEKNSVVDEPKISR